MGYVTRAIDVAFTIILSHSRLPGIFCGAHPGLPRVGWLLDSSLSQNRYLPMAYAIWIIACMCLASHSRPIRSRYPATANLLWAYTSEVKDLFSVHRLSLITPDVDVRLNAGSALSHQQVLTKLSRVSYPLDILYADRCIKTVFVEVFFFVWCTLIAQVVLSARYGLIPSTIPVDHHWRYFTLIDCTQSRSETRPLQVYLCP